MDPDPQPATDILPGPGKGLVIEIAEEAGDWSGFDAGGRIGPIAGALSKRLPDVAGVVALALADDAMVRDLNARFRNQDKPTNVLSFPSGEASHDVHAGREAQLGDVILAAETLRREAAAEAKPAADHFTHLVIHGILHLLGYDHESVVDAERMERLETAILADLDIDDPYAEPAIADSQAD
jgi:probable rRNA maturation factor